MYQIQPSSDPYSHLIAGAILREFPSQCHMNTLALVDLITSEILGTRQQRYGPKPSPEVLVSIRDVIRDYTDRMQPIPFLVPWGSEKPNGGGVDLAELWALKMLRCLSLRVSAHYMPGLVFRIRVEDASAPHLFFDRMQQAREDAKYYSDAFEGLVTVLELNDFIECVRESSLVTEAKFNDEADSIVPALEAYIRDRANAHAFEQMIAMGWKGDVAPETIEFYFCQFKKLYPADDDDKRAHRLARYFAAALTRKRLMLTGAHLGWGRNYIELAFFSSPPGTAAHFGRRIYYRTVPSSITANHMPPWRSKGYMLITNENELCPKLASFNDPQEYNQNQVTLVNGDNSVNVQADYIVA